MVYHVDLTCCDANTGRLYVQFVAFCVGKLKTCNRPHDKLPLHNLSTKVTQI